MADDGEQAKTIRLRYQGRREVCGVALPAGTQAWYDRTRRRARCLACPQPTEVATQQVPEQSNPAPDVVTGKRGRRLDGSTTADWPATGPASKQRWRLVKHGGPRCETAHPILGRLAVAVTARPDTRTPQHVRAWASGSDGEVKLGRRLAAWASEKAGRYVLHDRRAPGTKATSINW